ncbi:glycerophosphodiester phosphodiesterase [Weizmannia acidilactici]|uniref:glycerophosphodiester phosphodiesterase n=1 Tax=Weizmannia acidilactici TaxID=2607726 RepID=UPI00124EB37D|nr:glycerophosphodiester phosphodiesterase [Weizmannia acidilactici]GER68504.1 glycerophosphodiester phosphodiesterase [Weizmannia acidilactici]
MGETLIFGHRGSKGTHQENTLLGFAHACHIGAEGLELDVHMSKDGELVVIHDEKLDRTTTGSGYVKDLNLNEIKQYSAGKKFKHLSFYDSSWEKETVPTLEEVLELTADYQVSLNIELKTDTFSYPGIEKKALELSERYHLKSRIIFSSFNLSTLIRIKTLDPEAHTAFLTSKRHLDLERMIQDHQLSGLHLNRSFLISKSNLFTTEHSVPVRVWTVNSARSIKKALDLKLAGIITDYPEKALELKKKHAQSVKHAGINFSGVFKLKH